MISEKIVLKHFGRGRGDYLCIHFDVKWFWGVVIRKISNKLDGINPEAVRKYHKSHMSKAMSIAVVGVYFEDILYNGGKATNLFFKDIKVPNVYRERLFVIIMLLLRMTEASITLVVI